MPRDPRVDAYIARAAPFAQPILAHVRALMHRASPEIAEAIKWSKPFFDYKGAPLANMAAFKAHAAFGFWRREGAGPDAEKADAMGQFGKLTRVEDLPPEPELIAMIQAAMALIDRGVKTHQAPRTPRPEVGMPEDLRAALDAVPAAAAAYAGFPAGAQREYLEWVVEARAPATRAKRIAQTVVQCAEGKRRYWKYAAC